MTVPTVNACMSTLIYHASLPSIHVPANPETDYNPPGNEIVFPAGIMQVSMRPILLVT